MKKNKLILLQLLIAFVLITTSVYAAVTTTIALSVSEATAFRGDTVDVTLSLENVDEENKIQSIAGYINYDEEVIEPLTVDNIKQDEGNTVKIGNEVLKVEDLTNADINTIPADTSYVAFNGDPVSENDTRIVIDFKNGITEDTEILTIKFKVKETAAIGDVEKAISYSMFVTTADTEESAEITKDVKLTVKAVNADDENDTNKTNNAAKNENVENNTNTNTNENTNTNTNSNTNTNKNTNTNTNTNKNTNTNTNKNVNVSGNNTNTADNTVSGSNLPATGAKLIVIPAIMLVILAYVSYNRYMKYKDI